MLSASEIKKFVEMKKQQLGKEKERINPSNIPQNFKEHTKTVHNEEVPADSQETIKSVKKDIPDFNQNEFQKEQINFDESTDTLRTKHEKRQINQQPDEELNYQISGDGNVICALEEYTRSRERSDDERGEAGIDNFDEEYASATDDQHSDVDISNLLRKYSGLNIGMLRAGEYSPNNPEIMGEGRNSQRGGDVFLGLGLYEERRKKLLQKRQVEYREYLAKQNHINNLKKQAAIQQRLPPGRNLFLEEEKKAGRQDEGYSSQTKDWDKYSRDNSYETRHRRPSSVGVQTDPEELLELERRSSNALITKAERELSPRPSVNGNVPPADWRMLVEKVNIGTQNNLIVPPSVADKNKYNDDGRLQYGNEYFDPFSGIGNNVFRKDSPRAKLLQDLRHTYMPSLFDADTIKQRNMQMEQETAAKRMTYQQELKKQIDEQQRIREERKAREKLLEEAETRRLEEQLKMLKMSQENEMDKQKQLAIRMRKDANEFERRRVKLQSDIDNEKKNVRNVRTNHTVNEIRTTGTSRSDPVTRNRAAVSKQLPETERSRLPFYYSPPAKGRHENSQTDMMSYNIRRNNPYVGQDPTSQRLPYSTNVPEDSVFAQSIPVKNYNAVESNPVPYSLQRFTQEPNRPMKRPIYNDEVGDSKIYDGRNSRINAGNYINRNTVTKNVRPSYEPAFLSKNITEMIDTKSLRKNSAFDGNFDDSLPIPVMKELSKNERTDGDGAMTASLNSEAMKNVEQKWQVPAVQKNILRNNFTDDGKQENILTQLGSIRRQLQLEQLKLDQSQMFSKQKLIK